jgi:hypothetical protein
MRESVNSTGIGENVLLHTGRPSLSGKWRPLWKTRITPFESMEYFSVRGGRRSYREAALDSVIPDIFICLISKD